jgi:hypothetical protein
MMGVFNNLVIYGQDVPKPVGIGDPDLATAGHGMRKAIAFGTASKYLGCLKVKAVEWEWDPRGIGKSMVPSVALVPIKR